MNGFPCLIVREHPKPSERAILYFFGGGMVIGPDKGDLPVMRKLCRETGCDVWFPFYPLCMEHCITETYAMVYECYRKMITLYGGGNVSTCGFSSGGALALGIAAHNNAQPEPLPQPRHIVAVSPGEVPWNDAERARMQALNKRDVSIDYPELMKTVPPKFTAYQGFDALFHSLEGYIANTHNPMGDMVERTAIEEIGKYLPRAVKDGNDMEAREAVAFANTLSGYSMVVSDCTSEHSMEHAMSAFHPELPHGAGLIMISREYFKFWIDRHVCDDRFVDMARFLGKTDAQEPEDFITALTELQEACGVADLKMSNYGIKPDEFMELAKNARETMGILFDCDPAETTDEEIAGIYERSYK